LLKLIWCPLREAWGCFFIFLIYLFLFQVPPTRMNLQTFKLKKLAAQKGYDLLKSKADALKVRICMGRSRIRMINFFLSCYLCEHIKYQY
jgi:hypothetical protein